MGILNTICAYWYDCIRNEDVLEKDISINVRTRAILYPFDNDPFIFRKNDPQIKIEDEKINNFALSKAEGLDFYYGYPLLYYFDQKNDKQLVAPLFIIKVKFQRESGKLFLTKDEKFPVCGMQAFSKLGLRTEEIANINQSIQDIFVSSPDINENALLNEIMKVVLDETEISFNEELNPNKLSNSEKITEEMTAGVYNKSIIFTGDATEYNMHLIKDLLDLKDKNDLESTSLSFFHTLPSADIETKIDPVLPFPSNEYQIAAIQDIFKHSLSVITGPPGTGKSQFISNLIVNLFLLDKSVLFVSHTGEAVSVVNSRINQQFANLMMRTGNKDFRQELKGRFNDLLIDSTKNSHGNPDPDHLHSLWELILNKRDLLLKQDEMEKKFQQIYILISDLKRRMKMQNILRKVVSYFELLILKFRSNKTKGVLISLPTRINLENEIRNLEGEYYESCSEYVKDIYLNNMLNNKDKIGFVNTFINQVNDRRYGDDEIGESSFTSALKVLKVWSSTLKSLRANFPLKANIFDYVIFDEASQIDLPSAAPALYRAKKAIVVGDPMQLTHIAGITKERDYDLAKLYALTDNKNIYPSKIRYCDVSLYKAAENSLVHTPVFLSNHYRSEDQIISLCNEVFYDKKLKILSTLNYRKYPQNLPMGLLWEDVKGESLKLPTGSRKNQEEVDNVVNIFKKVWKEAATTELTIGIVTPYNAQRDAIFAKISKIVDPDVLENRIRVLTAHKFQGSEADIIIFSLVVSSQGNGTSDKWYNLYPQILNVSLSRARYLLYIVGDKEFCENRDGILRKIVNAYNKIKIDSVLEKYDIHAKFDTPTERMFFEGIQNIDFSKFGLRLVPKFVAKRYTLDFALIGKNKFDIEIDGMQHEIIGGLPVLEDVERDNYLREKEGWNILHFSNYRVLTDMSGIINELIINLSSV